jgi:hypothetical protein
MAGSANDRRQGMRMSRRRVGLVALGALAAVVTPLMRGGRGAHGQGYGAAAGVSSVRSAAGTGPEGIVAAVDAFRADLGGANNGVGGAFADGRREINWDGVPDARSAPNQLPGDFFNTTSARGIVFSTPGSGFAVSANEGVAAVRFADLNPAYESLFQVFSAQRLFTALDSTSTEARFFVPGSTTPAATRGFGAVFTNVRWPDAATIEYLDPAGTSLGVWRVPAGGAGGLSFLGVSWDRPAVGVVRIISGTAALGPYAADGAAANLVVMDDFLYGEPRAVGS